MDDEIQFDHVLSLVAFGMRFMEDRDRQELTREILSIRQRHFTRFPGTKTTPITPAEHRKD